MIVRDNTWQAVAIPPLTPEAVVAFESAWILLNNPVAYVTSKGYLDRSRAPRTGHWRDVTALTFSLLPYSQAEQDAAILAHIHYLRNRWRTTLWGRND